MDSSLNSANIGITPVASNNAILKRFYVPDIPSAYLQGNAGAVNEESKAEVTNRQKRVADLEKRQAAGREDVETKDREYEEFENLASEYLIAENVRCPSDAQNETINALKTSVSSIILTGADATGSARDQTSIQIATRMNELKAKADAARKTWNSLCEELESERKLLQKAKDRSGLDFGPVHGGKMFYAPHRENRSMVKSSEQIIVDIWGIINGPGMLDLNFNRLHNMLTNLRKSIKMEVRNFAPGESKSTKKGTES